MNFFSNEIRGCAIAGLLCACSSAPDPEPVAATGRKTTSVIDVSHFDDGGPMGLRNESIAFGPRLDLASRTLTEETGDFRRIYNRLPCQALAGNDNDALAAQGFDGAEDVASPAVRFESISARMPDDPLTGVPQDHICFAYHVKGDRWYGHFEPIATSYDADANESFVTLDVGAAGVDAFGLVIYWGYVREISFVAALEAQ